MTRTLLAVVAALFTGCTLSADNPYYAACNTDADCGTFVCDPARHVCVVASSEGEGEGENVGEGEGENVGEGEGENVGEGEGENVGEGEGMVGEGEGEGTGGGEGAPGALAESYADVTCGNVNDALLELGTSVVLGGATATGTVVVGNGDTLQAGVLPTMPGQPSVVVNAGNTLSINAIGGVVPGSYGFVAQTTSTGPVCLHVHVVDPALVVVRSASGPWNDASAWSTGQKPDASDAAYIPSGLNVVVTDVESIAAVFIEDGATLVLPLSGSSLTVDDAYIDAGTDSATGGGSFPAFFGDVRFNGTPTVVAGHVDRAGCAACNVHQIGSVKGTEINFVTQSNAAWALGPHRLDVSLASFDSANGGLAMDATAGGGIAHFDTLHHSLSSAVSGVLWAAGALAVDTLLDVSNWPASGPQHAIFANNGGTLSPTHYKGKLTVPAGGSVVTLSGSVDGTLVLDRHAQAPSGVVVNLLELDASGVVDDPVHWTVTSCSGPNQASPPCP